MRVTTAAPRFATPWPLPALLVWALCWGLCWGLAGGLHGTGLALPWAATVAAGCGAVAARWAGTPWRRLCVGIGFPLSFALTHAMNASAGGGMPGWVWLLPLALLALAYPVGAWRGAPMFPTRAGALRGLGACVPLPPGATILDAGCGPGDALVELRREYPRQRLVGIEWSWPLRLACGWRCRFAEVRRADLWRTDWSGCDLVYVFQRPDCMPRIAAKARRELRPGSWLASLEFAVPGLAPQRVVECADGRSVWLYRVGAPAPSSRRGVGR